MPISYHHPLPFPNFHLATLHPTRGFYEAHLEILLLVSLLANIVSGPPMRVRCKGNPRLSTVLGFPTGALRAEHHHQRSLGLAIRLFGMEVLQAPGGGVLKGTAFQLQSGMLYPNLLPPLVTPNISSCLE
jgi:hypothetical protein